MSEFVVLGAGVGGLPCASELEERFGLRQAVTRINLTGTFQFVPPNPWVVVGWRKPGDITVDHARVARKKQFRMIVQAAARVEPEHNNIAAEIVSRPATVRATRNAVRLADMGNKGIAFVALPQIPPRDVTRAKAGRWVQWAKIGFEWYFLRKLRKGKFESAYECWLRRRFGIVRLLPAGRHV